MPLPRLLFVVPLVLAVGCGSNEPPTPAAPAMDRAALEETKDRAVAWLENEDHAKADEAFVALAAQLPDEILPVRNLTICRLLALDGARADPAAARAAMETMVARESRSAPASWLAAQVLLHPAVQSAPGATDETTRALQLLEQACTLEPQDPAYPWALFEAGERAAGPARDKAVQALEKAHELLPGNLAVGIRRMGVQAESKDPAVEKTLEILKRQAGPIQIGLQKMGQDVNQLLDEALVAARKQDWGEVEFRALALTNITRSDSFVQADARRVDAHPFAALLTRFTGIATGTAPPSPAAELDVTFSTTTSSPLATAPGVLQLAHLDFDLDDSPDWILLRPGSLEVHRTPATTGPLQLPVPPGMLGFAVADLDRDTLSTRAGSIEPADGTTATSLCQDADPDLVLHGAEGLCLMRNHLDPATGARTLVEVAQSPEIQQLTGITALALLDFDHDSDLDLVVTTGTGMRLLSHSGDLVFEDVSRFSELAEVKLTAMTPVDWDRDVDLDLVAISTSPPALGVLENRLHHRFAWVPLAVPGLDGIRAVEPLEADGNASWDLVVADRRGLALITTASPGRGRVEPREPVRFATDPADGLVSGDLDGDGVLDLVSWSEGAPSLWHGSGTTFRKVDGKLPRLTGVTHLTLADHGEDGDLDLLVAAPAGVALWTNESGNRLPWLDLRLLGRADNRDRANHHGLGSLIELKSRRGYQARVVRGPSTLIGLGADPGSPMVRVQWPSGTSQWIIDARQRQRTCEPMVLKGSCPYLYAWDGARFRFVTDLLWSAPLGLRSADGSIVPPRPWEYLKVPGSALSAREGRYSLVVTEELWEACYFDHIELIAVDHPADVQIFTNEKVGPPDLAPHKLHTVSRPRAPVAARDATGRDLLPALLREDGLFARPFSGRIRQGLTAPQILELDLGDLAEARRVTLFLTGWIHPADSSLSMDFAQDSTVAGPEPPSLWAPDGSGSWRKISPYCGFPGGKTKTIALDLTGALTPGDPRIQLRTTCELSWDQAFVTLDEPEVPLKAAPLDLLSASLVYRGFSSRVEPRGGGPESYDFDSASLRPAWPPMEGPFTSYGDVADLLRSEDDALVVMASGDAMRLEFAALPPPPPGWERDFVLHSVGWDKDADLNTVHGQSSLPLPCRAMREYPSLDPEVTRTASTRALASRAHRFAGAGYWRK